ncbi:MAG: hypothetical protein OHK0013_39490 [Sandaracinaceae bacterium]
MNELDAPTPPSCAPAEDDGALAREAVRLYRRYAIEVVEALRFCPYAERCRLEGRTREMVSLDDALALERVLPLVHEAARDPQVEIGLLLFPRLRIERLAFARFVEQLRRAHQDEPGGLVMAMEGFHPDAAPDLSSADRLVPFVRRTPDPTIQLVRHEALLRVRRAGDHGTAFFDPSRMSLEALLAAPAPKPLHRRIAEANLETTRARTVEAIERIYDDIRRDRDQSYAKLMKGSGEPRPG